MEKVLIKSLDNYIDKEVTLSGWLTNRRSGKGLEFLIIRDGSGFTQCIVDESQVSEETFRIAKSLSQESSINVTGKVVKDERQVGGFEIHVKNVELIGDSIDYPITNKPHGGEFLMDKRQRFIVF